MGRQPAGGATGATPQRVPTGPLHRMHSDEMVHAICIKSHVTPCHWLAPSGHAPGFPPGGKNNVVLPPPQPASRQQTAGPAAGGAAAAAARNQEAACARGGDLPACLAARPLHPPMASLSFPIPPRLRPRAPTWNAGDGAARHGDDVAQVVKQQLQQQRQRQHQSTGGQMAEIRTASGHVRWPGGVVAQVVRGQQQQQH